MNNKVIDLTTRIAVLSSALVILAAAVLSFTALYDLFLQIGLFAGWLAILFPLLFDLAELAAAVTVLNAKLQGENDRFAWGLVIGFTVAGMLANIAHAAHAWHIGRIDSAQFALAVVFTSLFPLSIALVTHLLKRTIERQINRTGMVESLADLQHREAQARAGVGALEGELVTLTGKRDDLHKQIEALRKEKRSEAGDKPAGISDETKAAAWLIMSDWANSGQRIVGARLARELSDQLGRKIGSRTGQYLAKEFGEALASAAPEPEPVYTNGNGVVK